MGGEGAAWATTIVMTFCCSVVIYASAPSTMRALKLYHQFVRANFQAITNILKLGIPIALNIAAEISFFAIIPLMVAHLGANAAGAHAIAHNIDALAFMVPLGVAQALTIKVAHAEGSGDPRFARQVCLVGFKLVFVLALVMAAIKISCATILPPPSVAILAFRQLLSICSSLPRYWAASTVYRCVPAVHCAALDVRLPLLIQVTAFWVIAFPIAYSLALTDFWGEPLGIYGFWIGMIMGASCAGICSAEPPNIVSVVELLRFNPSSLFPSLHLSQPR